MDQGKPKQKHIYKNPTQILPGGEWTKNSPEEKDIGVLGDKKYNMTQQIVFVA